METITPPPSDRAARETWTVALRQVLAYRDRYQITSSTDTLGPTAEGERGEARLIAMRVADHHSGRARQDRPGGEAKFAADGARPGRPD